ncbi:hypothetical protein BSKO_07550 [Bryopsis sp. KO-2023]|nr:hypothetical protein BSKO_07550 [Bryopsis sp. KO-2023]
MFEAQAAYYLNKYLGRYVDGVDTNSLQISVWNGDVVLRNLRVRPEALTDLNLPVTVRAGLLGTLRLKVPWNKLGKEPVVVEMDKLYVLAGPFEEPGKFDSEKVLNEFVEAFEARMHEQKRRRVKAIELEWMQRKDGGEHSDEEKSGGYLQYYIETILGNLELKITNVHIRYEDGQSSPGQKFGVGFTLGELSGHTVDKKGNRAFVNAKQMDQIRKRINLKRLAMYFDADSELWGTQGSWAAKTEQEWDSFFLPSIHKDLDGSRSVYILRPVDGQLTYLRRRKISGKDLLESEARQEIDMSLQEISIHASRQQYEHVQNLLTSFNLYQLSLPHRQFRPPCRPLNSKSVAMWWVYAIKAVRLSILGRSTSSPFMALCSIRRMYIPHYVRCLQQGNVGGDKTISSIEKNMEEDTILVFRRLAHVKVEQHARQTALKAAANKPVTWGEWLWGTKPSVESVTDSSKTQIASLSEEDWAAFDSLVGVHDDDDTQHTPWTLLSRIRANVGTCGASLTDENNQQILYGAWTDAIVVNKVYPETNSFDFSIGQGTMRCPSGTLISPGNSPHTSDSEASNDPVVVINYTHQPQDRPVKAAVKIKAACACITYHASALEAVLDFFKPVDQADFSVLEAQAAAGLRKARKAAEEQILGLLNEDREILDLDLEMDAPKLAIPVQTNELVRGEECTLLLDLGYLRLITDADGKKELLQKEVVHYECLELGINDVAISVVDGEFCWPDHTGGKFGAASIELEQHLRQRALVIPILERCGLKSKIQFTRGRHAGSTPVRLDFEVPMIRFHFSPSRYGRAMKVLNSLIPSARNTTASPTGCEDVSFSAHAKILNWEGLGRRIPKWLPHYITVRQDCLYIYKSKRSMEIVKWVRLAEDVQILPLRASQALGKHNVVGLVPLGIDAKNAVEDVSSVMLCMGSRTELQDLLREIELAKRKIAMLTGGMTMETALMEIPGEEKTTDVVESGAIVEAKGIVNELLIFISGRPPLDEFCQKDTGQSPGLKLDTSLEMGKAVMMSEEVPLVVLREKMGKLDLTFSPSGLEVDLSVNQFAVEDLLIGSSEGERTYLAISRDPDSAEVSQDANTGGDYGRLIYRKRTQMAEDFTGADSELILEFSSLWCECHRPTIAALIAMGLDVSDALAEDQENQEASMDDSGPLNLQGAPSEVSMVSSIPQWGDPDRSLFRLSLTMKKLELSANYEDSRKDHMAIAVVENFKYDLDVHPETIRFTGSLGNAVIWDGSIPEGHPNRQLCGLRSETQESLISVVFQSHTISESYSNDRIPNGAPFYSLSASLSAVRLVFFYRWLQELLMYIFVMLDMTPERLGDSSTEILSEELAAALQVPGFDVGGSEAVTMVLLDVKLDAPIVHMPRNSDVQECIVVDLGRVQVSNRVRWLGASERGTLVDDILVKCMDMSAAVFQGSVLGSNMIEDLGEGTDIRVLRKLRDPPGVLPLYQVWVGIPTIHCRVTDVEYEFIVSTVLENMREATRIPPQAFAMTEMLYPEVAELQTMEPTQKPKNRPSQLSRISSSGGREQQGRKVPVRSKDPAQVKLRANVAIDSAQLTLMNAHKSGGSPIPLGRLQLAKFQLSYRATAGGDMNVQISVPTIEAIDLRPNEANKSTLVLSSSRHQAGADCAGTERLTPSLIVLDYNSIGEEQSVNLRLQRPTLMLELGSQLGFILAVTEFAVPSISLGANMNKEFSTRDILLDEHPYVAETDMWVSPEVRILADRPGVSKFVLDGGGHRLILPNGIAPHEMLPMILIGVGKSLQLKNITIVNAGSLGSIVQLGPGGQILMAENDGIEFIEGDDPRMSSRALRQRSSIQRSLQSRETSAVLKFKANISATGVTLHVVDKSSSGVNQSRGLPSQQSLVAMLDLESSFLIDGNDYLVEAQLNRVMVESAISLAPANPKDPSKCCEISNRILEPCSISAKYIASNRRQSIDLNIDQLVVNITPDLLDLILDIRTLVVDPLTVPSASQPVAKVSTFRMIWSSQDASLDESVATRFDSSEGLDRDKGYITLWRPQPPAGYGILGDVITCGQKQCRQQVSTVALNSGLVANPISFDKVWVYDGVTIWFPRAPKNYHALGCVASVDGKPPPTTLCLCVHAHVLVESSLGECLWLKPPKSLWSVQNGPGTFLTGSESLQKPEGGCFDLRSPIGIAPNALSYVSTSSLVPRSAALSTASQKCFNRFVDNRKNLLKDQTARRMTMTTVEFKKIWVDKEASGGNGAGIWRPVVPQGYAVTGDCLEYDGMAPPNGATVIFDSATSDFKGSRLLTPPVRFDKIWEDNSGKRDKRLTIYRPVPQHGYVAMGYIAAMGGAKLSLDSVRCVNLEAVTQSLDGIGRPHVEMKKNKRHIYGWVSDPKSRAFVISSQADAPPSGDMWKLNLSDDKIARGGDDGQGQFELKVHSGPTSLQIRDLTRIPILEVETHNLAIAASNAGVLMTAYMSFDTSLWSYNSMLKAWEPVMETANFIMHVNQNTSGTDLGGVPPGMNLRVTSSGDAIRLTLAYSAVNSIAKLYRDKMAIKDQKGTEMPSSALIGVDASSIETTVINMLGSPVFLLCDYGTSQSTFELNPINEIQVQLPLAPPPSRHDRSVKWICPKPVLVVGVRHFQLVKGLIGMDIQKTSAMRCVVRFSEVDTPHTVRTCASGFSDNGKLTIDEQFIFDLPEETARKTLVLDVYDITSSSHGEKVATGQIALTNIAADSVQEFVVRMVDSANRELGSMTVELHLEGSKPLFTKNQASNAHQGERGVKLRQNDSWVPVPSTGVQQGKKTGAGSMLGFDQSSLVVAVNVGRGIVLESGYRNGTRQEVVRSLCTFSNSTKTSLMVRLLRVDDKMQRVDSMSSLGASGSLADMDFAEEEVYENQRRAPMRPFSHKSLIMTDRKRFSLKSTGHHNSDNFPDILLPPGWEWMGPWEVEVTGNVDSEGWCYATDFKLMKYPPGRGSEKKGAMDFTRRRRWVRRRRKKSVDRPEFAELKGHSSDVSIVLPGSSFPLPQIPSHGHWQLQVRPVIEGKTWHRWSRPVAEDGVVLQELVEGTRRLAFCPMKSAAGGEGTVNVPQELLCSSEFWLTFIVEGNRLPVPVGMDPMTDWTITAQPPLELHNVLPFSGSFMVWERAEGGSPLQIRQQGITSPGEKTPIHGADMRKEVALSFYPTDRDFQEEAPITISRGYSEQAAGVSGHQNLPPNFRVSKQGNVARVMLERELDVGVSQREEKLDPGAAVAMGYPLVLRMYVPLWVVNNTEVPINLGIVGIRPGDVKVEPDLDGNGGTDVNSIKFVTTFPEQHSYTPPAYTMSTVDPQGTDILSYPLDENPYGVKISVVNSGWTTPIPLGGVKMSKESAKSGKEGSSSDVVRKTLEAGVDVTQRMLVWAQVPDVAKIFPTVAHLDLTASGFIRSKVLILEPHLLVSNRTGIDIQLLQPNTLASARSRTSPVGSEQLLPAGVSCEPLQWALGCQAHLLCARPSVPGALWSVPFRIAFPEVGDIDVAIPNFSGSGPRYLDPPAGISTANESSTTLKILVQISSPGCLHVIFQSFGGAPPYAIENRTQFALQFRQEDPVSPDPWITVPPLSSQGWALPRLVAAAKRIEIRDVDLAPKSALTRSFSLNPDMPLAIAGGTSAAPDHALPLAATVEGIRGLQQTQALVEIVDMDDSLSVYSGMGWSFGSAVGCWGQGRVIRIHPEDTSKDRRGSIGVADGDVASKAFGLNLSFSSISLSLVDQHPQELLLLTVEGLEADMMMGVGPRGRFAHARVRVRDVQLDNQLPHAFYPVLVAPWITRARGKSWEEPLTLSLTVVRELGSRQGHMSYPTITSKIGNLQVAIHETIIWRVMDMVELLGIKSSGEAASADVSLDVGLLHVGGIKFKVSISTDPTSRPRSQPLSLGLEFANVEDVEVEIKGYEAEDLSMLQSVFMEQILAHLKGQISGIALSLLDHVFSVGGVSQALAAMGKVIKSSVDDPRSRDNKTTRVDSLQDGLIEGTAALGKGFLKGVTGVIQRPVKGAKKEGVEGFFKGVGKGLLGVAVNPLSGVFEAASKVTEGIDILTSKAEIVAKRKRPPLCIRGDQILRVYNQMDAAGQSLMHDAISSGGKGDQESYGGHRVLANDRMLMWTTERIAFLRGNGLHHWQAQLAKGHDNLQNPQVKRVWSLKWDNLLSLNLEIQNGSDALAIFSKTRCNSFNSALVQIILTEKGVAQELRNDLWAAMGRSHLDKSSLVRWAGAMESGVAPFRTECGDFAIVWKSHHGFAQRISIWRLKCPAGYASLGHVVGSPNPPNTVPVFWDDSESQNGGAAPKLAIPLGFSLIFRDTNPQTGKLTIWRPLAPKGYVAVGLLIVPDICMPSLNDVRCLREDLCVRTDFEDHMIWRGGSSDLEDLQCSLWTKEGDPLHTFHAVRSLEKPDRRFAWVAMRDVVTPGTPKFESLI